jgi:prepilin-type N-terminal cleavage/methylation domain-containing protein
VVNGFTTKAIELVAVRHQGFSLVELMIAMSLSLFLMLAVYKIFDVQQYGFELIGALNDREDNAQLAMEILSDGIRMADHWGGVNSQEVSVLPHHLSAAPGDCDASWVFDIREGIYGVEGRSSAQNLSSLPHKCLKNKDYVEESDLLVLRFGDSHEYFKDSEIDNKRYQKHYFLRAQSGRGAILFQGKLFAQAIQNLPDEGFHYNMLFHSSLYFLRPCQKNSNGCIAGNSVLTRLILMGDRYIQEALVEGIEQMQFEYGVDDNQDGSVDRYEQANTITNWQNVLSVRFYLLVRSRLQDQTIDEKGKIYVMNSLGSQEDDAYIVPDNVRFYPRKLYQSEVSLRNRLVN